mmetsp:Transcript_29877/g.68863  ORF Transcript_29877/g.68863 Transcript_29877/m.68863 type:complete len:428 (+) Transcript_29877:48-1331(+)
MLRFEAAPCTFSGGLTATGPRLAFSRGRSANEPVLQMRSSARLLSGASALPKPCAAAASALALQQRLRHRSRAQCSAARKLYPAGKLISSGKLEVSDDFELYYEEHGAADGVPAVFLHGGPGAGFTKSMAQLFDLKRYRVVLFHQRGCKTSIRKGTSAAGEQLQGNSTWHLVEDLESLRLHLGFSQWVVAGGSWGSCLAIAYATRHPENVIAVVMRAAFLFRPTELEYFCGPSGGARANHPSAWKSFTDWLPWAEDASAATIAAAFRRAALGQDSALKPEAAIELWKAWERKLFMARATNDARLPEPHELREPRLALPDAKLPDAPGSELSIGSAQALLTMHYVAEEGFLLPGLDLLKEAEDLTMPVKIIHGRCDSVCLAQTALELADAAPEAELFLTDDGHSQWGSENVDSFLRATDDVLESILVS